MLKLNNYDFEFGELFEESPITLEIRLKHMNDPSVGVDTKKRACWVLSEEYKELACAHYVLENYNEAKFYLKEAAPFAYLTGFDSELKGHNNEWTIQGELNVALLFGDETIINKLREHADDFTTSSVTKKAIFLYDHLLICNWDKHVDICVDDFISRSYQILDKRKHQMPDKIRFMYRYMRRDNWLGNYKYEDGIRRALRGIGKRIGFGEHIHEAFEIFQENSERQQNEKRGYILKIGLNRKYHRSICLL